MLIWINKNGVCCQVKKNVNKRWLLRTEVKITKVIMFSDKSGDPVGFESKSTTNRLENTICVQTDAVISIPGCSQTAEKKSVETQTIEELPKKPVYNYENLVGFLNRVTPDVLKALDEIHGDDAFDDYDPGISDDTSNTIKLLSHINTVTSTDTKSKVSGVTWSTYGGTLALGHGVTYHETWCDHLSKIKFYNLTRDDQLISAPKKILEVNACVTSLTYHPSEPSILAAGLFNGDILVWNLREDTSITPLNVCTHGDSVTQVQWQSRFLNEHILVSSSSDGYILMHKLTVNFTAVNLHKRFKIAKEHNPAESVRPRSAGGSRERAIEAGLSITCFDFSNKDSALFIVGTLCGGLYKCNTEQSTPIEGDTTIQDPIINEYDRHDGSVTCVKCSPIQNLFVSAGTDKEIRIYNFDQVACQRTIDLSNTAVGLTWYYGNQNLLAAYGVGTAIDFYNILDDDTSTQSHLESKYRANASCMSFNFKRNLVAVGDTTGILEVWKVPRQSIN